MYALQSVPGDKSLIPELVAILKDRNSNIRYNVPAILARLGKDGLQPLTEILKDKDNDNRYQAAYALQNIDVPLDDLRPVAKMLMEDKDQNLQQIGVNTLGRFKAKVLPEITELLKSDKAVIRWSAANVIGIAVHLSWLAPLVSCRVHGCTPPPSAAAARKKITFFPTQREGRGRSPILRF